MSQHGFNIKLTNYSNKEVIYNSWSYFINYYSNIQYTCTNSAKSMLKKIHFHSVKYFTRTNDLTNYTQKYTNIIKIYFNKKSFKCY